MAPPLARVIIADWSAASTVHPAPRPDRCWVAVGDVDTLDSKPVEPVYSPSRRDAIDLIARAAAHSPGRVLVGVDFPLAYPAWTGLPAGRALARKLARLVVDEPHGASNRFAVAAQLNAAVASRRGLDTGPFWGRPATLRDAQGRSIPPRRPALPEGLDEFRVVERLLVTAGDRPQPCFKLYTAGSVGSQMILGLAWLWHLAQRPELAGRVRFWPFETDWSARLPPDAVVIAEVWPSLLGRAPANACASPIKDARQVAHLRASVLASLRAGEDVLARPAGLSDAQARLARRREGWILGVRPAALTNASPSAGSSLRRSAPSRASGSRARSRSPSPQSPPPAP